jgi:PIN domain nuclease of toxin-antitoxin system
MPTLLDTHAWIWWVTRDRRLSPAARRAITAAQGRQTLWVSLISAWEVAKKVEKNQLVLDRPLTDWLDQATSMPGLQMAELTQHVLVESCRLPARFAGDPADQIIVATARDRDATLVTKDDRLREYGHVRTLW